MDKKEKKPEPVQSQKYRLIHEFDEKGRPINELMMDLIKKEVEGWQKSAV